jgi:uncharacterized membrane protein
MSKNKKIVSICYILQGLGVFFFLPLLVSVIIGHIKRGNKSKSIVYSHLTWQIRTFWFYILWFCIGTMISLLSQKAIPILFVNHIWLIYRIIKGFMAFGEGKNIK